MQGKLGMNLRELREDAILDAGGNRSTRKKSARASIDWEPNSHTTHLARLEIEPGPHWWKAREQPLRQPDCPNNHSLAIFVSPELISKSVYVCAILQNWSLYPHTLIYSHGTWTQGSLGSVTHVTSADLGSKVIWGSMTIGSSFWKKVTVSTYFDIFSWNLDKMILRQSHTCDLNRSGVKVHLGVIDLLVKFWKIVSLYPHSFISWELD